MTSPNANLVLPFPAARRRVEQYAAGVRPTSSETVDLLAAAGRVLAHEIVADRDLPPFPRATRDGYAVAAMDVAQPPARLQVGGEIQAGMASAISLGPGEAVEIMTGAPLPDGADCVVMVEYTRRDQDIVEIARAAAPSENVVPAGAEARSGEVLLPVGTRLTPAAIAVAASVGRAAVQVHQRPRVAILATGDELVEVDQTPGPVQIRNSNSYSLAAQVIAAGGEPLMLPIARDQLAALRQLIAEGLRADLLLLSGGVSMGKYDLVEQVLGELGAQFFFTGALIQPGRPIVFGEVSTPDRRVSRPFFGLPGNPVSTMVCFELFARVVLDALAGTGPHKLAFLQAKLKREIKTKIGLTRFLPALLTGELEITEVELVRWQGSGDIAAAARANCYVVVPPDCDSIKAGERVSILRL